MSATITTSRRPRPKVIARPARPLEEMIDRVRFRSWFAGKDFTTDWASSNFTTWRRVLSPLRREPLRLLEIGSWEGRSAVFFLKFFVRSTIVCVDTFSSSPQESGYEKWASVIGGIEQRFDHNLAAFGTRVEKIEKSRSGPALERLAADRRQFDFAYIDGSHRRDDVMADSLGVWQLIAPRGVIIWDDYGGGEGLPAEERPGPAIDDFLRTHASDVRELARGYQIAIERLK